eukprot:TRINITY_DN1677_c1_g1_i3.p5 TRINITY_DN1677_c1_g1~~TRINITY_DN1677_c1_g1_i3.p5  ORF type:complete len:128 (-),score=6.78 TRINITY_DN1677_c1_g1_i3:1414-1797(-)
MAYCGCSTQSNQIRWAIFGFFLAVFVAFLLAFITMFVKATNDYNDCMEPYTPYRNTIFGNVYEQGKKQCEDQIRDDYQTKVTAFEVIFIVALIVSTIPLCVMCCCTNPPSPTTYYTGTPIASPQNKW